MRTKIVHILSPVLVAAAALMRCAPEYNPFSDFSNARALVTGSTIGEGDTVDVFSTETLVVTVTVKELVDRIEIRAGKNRLWTGETTVISHDEFVREPFIVLSSFHDTGEHAVTVSSVKINGDRESLTRSFHVRSPLQQQAVLANLGDTVVLRTPAVRDRDVTYTWSFGSTIFMSQTCSTRVALAPAILSGMGAVWVADEQFVSPAFRFPFTLRDTTAPQIVCANPGFVGADTVYTADTLFGFRVRITDAGDRSVDSASINGEAFDSRFGPVYYKLFDRMHLHDRAKPLVANVYALDRFVSGNVGLRRFTIIFSDSAAFRDRLSILPLAPSRDTITVSSFAFMTFGRVEATGGALLDAQFEIHAAGDSLLYRKEMRGGDNTWIWRIDLREGENRIRMRVIDSATGDTARAAFVVIFDPIATDSMPPVIASVAADGRPASGLYTDKPAVRLAVNAFDEQSGIDSLTINGRYCPPAVQGGVWFYDSVALVHSLTGSEIVVRARDRAGNTAAATVVIFRNRAPVIEGRPASAMIPAESLYTAKIVAHDPDGDKVSFQKQSGPAWLRVDASGTISWTPLARDTGAHTVRIQVWDGLQPVYVTYTVLVYPPGGRPPEAVRFDLHSEDFPRFLIAGQDTMGMVLRVARNCGIPPFLFSARLSDRGTELLRNSRDSLLVWAPAAGDTGYRQMAVTVRDQIPAGDTLFPGIWVVPPNRPCSLSISFSSDTLPGGALNLNEWQRSDTLAFRIRDPDPGFAERYDITLYQARPRTTSRIDSALVDSFSLVIDPRSFDGYDTVRAVVTDRGGHSDTLTKVIYYGVPPLPPANPYPADYGLAAGPAAVLSWTGEDPDGDSLWYEVIWGTGLGELSGRDTTLTPALPVTGLARSTTYYWSVFAHDWKSRTAGPVWRFTTSGL